MLLDARDETDGPTALIEDSVSIYLRDIGSAPLLTAEQEVELGRRIERGLLAAKRLQQPLDDEERAAALADKKRGEQARHVLVESNLRLVVSIARRYFDCGVPVSDLIEEGNIGLMRAADKFDYRRGFRFSTYATWWVRQAVYRAMASQSRVVRLPVHVSELMNRVSKASHKLSQELGKEPTAEEIAAETQLRPERVRELIVAWQRPISLEQPYGEGGEGVLADVIEDQEVEQPVDQVARAAVREEVRDALTDLTEREQTVIRLRYGFASDRRRSLDEVGKAMGVTRERIRQIEKEAFTKLRQQGRLEALRTELS